MNYDPHDPLSLWHTSQAPWRAVRTRNRPFPVLVAYMNPPTWMEVQHVFWLKTYASYESTQHGGR